MWACRGGVSCGTLTARIIKKIRHKKWQKYQQPKKNMDDNTETLSKMANELANSKCTLRKKNEAEMKAKKAKEKNVEHWQESLC